MFFLFLLLLLSETARGTVYNVTKHSPRVQSATPLRDARHVPSLPGFNVYLQPIDEYYIAYPEERKTGCIQVLTSSFLSKAYCSLPPYCKHTQYKEIVSGWFSSVGVCYGISTPLKVISYPSSTENKIYDMHLDMSQGWCSIARYENLNQSSYPDSNLNHKILVLICLEGMYIMSLDVMTTYTRIMLHQHNNTYTLYHPKLEQSEDGRFCAPRFQNSPSTPFVLGPFTDEDELVRNIPMFYYYVYVPTTNAPSPLQIDFVSRIQYNTTMRQVTITNDADPSKYICEPYKHTLNLLPFSVGSIFATVVHVAELILQWTLDGIVYIFDYLYKLLDSLNLLSMTSFIFVTYATFKYGNAYAICVSYFLSIFVIVALRTILS